MVNSNRMAILAAILILGGIMQFPVMFFNNWMDNDIQWIDITTGVMDMAAGMLVMIGLASLFYHVSQHANLNVFISLIAASIGTLFLICAKFIDGFVIPMLKVHAPTLAEEAPYPASVGMGLCFVLFVVGWVYFGVSAAFNKSLPRTASILTAVWPVTFFVPIDIFISPAVWGVGIIWIGLVLYRNYANSTVIRPAIAA